MPRRKAAANNPKKAAEKSVGTITHAEAKRKNIPSAEHQSVMRDEDKSPIQVAYERRNPHLDPQLVRRGKDVQDWSDVVVQAGPVYVQEPMYPKVLIDDLQKVESERWRVASGDSAISRPIPKPETGRIAVKAINHLGDEVMKVFRVGWHRLL